MFEPFGQAFPPSEAVVSSQVGRRLARVGIWLFWLLLVAIIVARGSLVATTGLFNFAG